MESECLPAIMMSSTTRARDFTDCIIIKREHLTGVMDFMDSVIIEQEPSSPPPSSLSPLTYSSKSLSALLDAPITTTSSVTSPPSTILHPHGLLHQSDVVLDTKPGVSVNQSSQYRQLIPKVEIKPKLGVSNGFALPRTPPSCMGSDSEDSLSPDHSTIHPASPPTICINTPSMSSSSSSGSTKGNNNSSLINSQPKGETGVLILQMAFLTEEEKRKLRADGYPIPQHLPLTRAEECSLKKIRRTVKQRVSAQESRRKKKEYMESLEKKVELLITENSEYKKKMETLEGSNKSLLSQLLTLQADVGEEPCKSTESECFPAITISSTTGATDFTDSIIIKKEPPSPPPSSPSPLTSSSKSLSALLDAPITTSSAPFPPSTILHPQHLPLPKAEECSLKKIKNRISAQVSRRKRKEYVESLEKKIELLISENSEYKKEMETLEGSNKSLLSQLQRLQAVVGEVPCKYMESECFPAVMMSSTTGATDITDSVLIMQEPPSVTGVPDFTDSVLIMQDPQSTTGETDFTDSVLIMQDPQSTTGETDFTDCMMMIPEPPSATGAMDSTDSVLIMQDPPSTTGVADFTNSVMINQDPPSATGAMHFTDSVVIMQDPPSTTEDTDFMDSVLTNQGYLSMTGGTNSSDGVIIMQHHPSTKGETDFTDSIIIKQEPPSPLPSSPSPLMSNSKSLSVLLDAPITTSLVPFPPSTILYPQHLLLTEAKECPLKRMRHLINCRVSAEKSRKKKKEYMDSLEKKVELLISENSEYEKKMEPLEVSNKFLLYQLRRLQAFVCKSMTSNYTQTLSSSEALRETTVPSDDEEIFVVLDVEGDNDDDDKDEENGFTLPHLPSSCMENDSESSLSPIHSTDHPASMHTICINTLSATTTSSQRGKGLLSSSSSFSSSSSSSSSVGAEGNTNSSLVSNQPKEATGILILTEEERRTRLAEGCLIPERLPLRKAEEPSLKYIRRKIHNRISARISRRKRKEYLDSLKKKAELLVCENCEYKNKMQALEGSNKFLLSRLLKLQVVICKSRRSVSTQTSSSSKVPTETTATSDDEEISIVWMSEELTMTMMKKTK